MASVGVAKCDRLPEVSSLNLCDRKVQEGLLARQLSKAELGVVLSRVRALLRREREPEVVGGLNELRRELRSKYSISLSRDVIEQFVLTSEKVGSPRDQLSFGVLDREIKNSLAEISRKKYYLSGQNKQVTLTRKILSADKRRRRHLPPHSDVQIRSIKNFDQMFIREKLALFEGVLEAEEVGRLEEELLARVEAIEQLGYGRFAQRVKHYTVYDSVLQRLFALVQEDTRHIALRSQFHHLYRRMKEEMVAIVTNEEEVTAAVRALKARPDPPRHSPKGHPKKNYLPERDRQDLTAQIEDTLEAARRHLKDAFIKRGRPDCAYEMELMLENRRTPTVPKRLRF